MFRTETALAKGIKNDIHRLRKRIAVQFGEEIDEEESQKLVINEELGEILVPIKKIKIADLGSRKLVTLKQLGTLQNHINALRFWTLNNGAPVMNFNDGDFDLGDIREDEEARFLRQVTIGDHKVVVDTEESLEDGYDPLLLGIITPSPYPRARLHSIFDFEGGFELNVLFDDLSEMGHVALGTSRLPISRLTTKEHRLINYSLGSVFHTIYSDSRTMVQR